MVKKLLAGWAHPICPHAGFQADMHGEQRRPLFRGTKLVLGYRPVDARLLAQWLMASVLGSF